MFRNKFKIFNITLLLSLLLNIMLLNQFIGSLMEDHSENLKAESDPHVKRQLSFSKGELSNVKHDIGRLKCSLCLYDAFKSI